jgi:hypothetical protein
MSATQLDTENADRNLTAIVTVLTHTPSASVPTICQGLVLLGDGTKNLDGSGGSFQLTITVGGQTIQPNPQTVTFSTAVRSAVWTTMFPVPANAEVVLRILSPNAADTDVDVTAYLYDLSSVDVGKVAGTAQTARDLGAGVKLANEAMGGSSLVLTLGQLVINSSAAGGAVNIDNSNGPGIDIASTGFGICAISSTTHGAMFQGDGVGLYLRGDSTADVYLVNGTFIGASGAVVDKALADINLDHLLAVACAGNVITGAVVDNSALALILAKADGDISDYDPATDSLEAIRDKLPANLEDLAVEDTTGRVDVGKWLGTAAPAFTGDAALMTGVNVTYWGNAVVIAGIDGVPVVSLINTAGDAPITTPANLESLSIDSAGRVDANTGKNVFGRRVLYVAKTGNNGDALSWATAKTTLEALTPVDGDLILVGPGSFEGETLDWKAVTVHLRGAGPNATFIKSDAAYIQFGSGVFENFGIKAYATDYDGIVWQPPESGNPYIILRDIAKVDGTYNLTILNCNSVAAGTGIGLVLAERVRSLTGMTTVFADQVIARDCYFGSGVSELADYGCFTEGGSQQTLLENCVFESQSTSAGDFVVYLSRCRAALKNCVLRSQYTGASPANITLLKINAGTEEGAGTKPALVDHCQLSGPTGCVHIAAGTGVKVQARHSQYTAASCTGDVFTADGTDIYDQAADAAADAADAKAASEEVNTISKDATNGLAAIKSAAGAAKTASESAKTVTDKLATMIEVVP